MFHINKNSRTYISDGILDAASKSDIPLSVSDVSRFAHVYKEALLNFIKQDGEYRTIDASDLDDMLDKTFSMKDVTVDFMLSALREWSGAFGKTEVSKIEALLKEYVSKSSLGVFHQQGRLFFGSGWDKARPAIVSAVTNGRETSSKNLKGEELYRGITLLRKFNAVKVG